MTVCFYHVTYAFQSESTLYSCLNVKELLARSRREIWNLSDCNWTRTHLYGEFDCMFLSCHVRVSESSCSHLNFRFRACFEQGVAWHSGNYRVWIHYKTRTWHDKNIQSNSPYRLILTTQLNHLASLAKWLSVCLWTKWLWVRVQLQSLKYLTCSTISIIKWIYFV